MAGTQVSPLTGLGTSGAPAALYAAALTSLGEGVILQGPDSAILAANDAAPRILGLTVDQLMGRTSFDPQWRAVHRDGSIFPVEMHPVPVALREKRSVRDVVMGVPRPDGGVAWLMVNAEPIPDAPGVPEGSVVCSFTDITAQIELDDRYRLLAENSSDVVVLADDQRRVEWVSPSVEQSLGWTPSQLVGRDLPTLVHPDDLRALVARQRALLEAGLSSGTAQARYATADGGWRWMEVSGRLLTDPDGRRTGDLSSLRDIEAEVQARAAVAAARDELDDAYRLLADHTSAVVFRGDNDGIIRWITSSVRSMLGWEPDEMLGRPAADFIHPDDLPMAGTAQEAILQEEPRQLSARLLRRDGAYRRCEAWVRPVHDAAGVVIGRVGSWRDVESELSAREAAAGSEALLQSAMRSAAIGMGLTDVHGAFAFANPALCRILQRDEGWLLSHRIDDIVNGADSTAVDVARDRLTAGDIDAFEAHLQIARGDGVIIWAKVAAVLVGDGADPQRRFLVQLVDVTAERAAQEELSYQAFHDALTGLRNRAWILDMLDVDLRTARRSSTGVGVFFIDLDNFKLVNDSLGHAAGDEVLATVADRIASVLRPVDRVGRFGGDEFVVVVPDVTDGQEIERVAERISNAIATELVVQGHRIVPTASMGIAVSSSTSTAEDLLRDTDSALFRAKDAGRARWHFFDQAMHAQAVARLTLEDELRHAIVHDEFVLHYQPIVLLDSCRVVGHEALVRWQHPARGLLAPGEFLGVAEDSGLIVDIGLRTFDQVCALLAARPDLPGPINVNVSAVELSSRDWLHHVVDCLGRHAIEPSRLVVEVTETAVLSLLDGTHSDLAELRRLGVGVQVDDFGTGFSSISLLRDLPVTGIKLDASFVAHLTREESAPNTLAAGVSGLARGLHLAGIAEGVETAEQARTLLSLGWSQAQGYLFGRPEAEPRTRPLVESLD
jgi:diguanylate cyclase (GGDEF)-like protein/PAS domain S-box-containing protein